MSRGWHKRNKDAASHLFGFASWKETVYYIHALFGLLPPRAKPHPEKDKISDFEACLMAKIRIHRGMPITQIGLIWGPSDRRRVGEKVRHWIKKWGEAGRDLSILPINESFLDRTCPQAYKDEGLSKICAVPDGKDFKIETKRQNSLFTRASRSEATPPPSDAYPGPLQWA